MLYPFYFVFLVSEWTVRIANIDYREESSFYSPAGCRYPYIDSRFSGRLPAKNIFSPHAANDAAATL